MYARKGGRVWPNADKSRHEGVNFYCIFQTSFTDDLKVCMLSEMIDSCVVMVVVCGSDVEGSVPEDHNDRHSDCSAVVHL